MSELKERINILKEGEVINELTAHFVLDIIDQELKEFDSLNALEMFTTHLAMATQRILNQEEVDYLNDEIYQQVEKHPSFSNAFKLYTSIVSKAPCVFPEGEKRFLLMHLCNLYQL